MKIPSLICFLVAAAPMATPAAAAKPPLELAPASDWRVHSGSDSCQLSRVFGGGVEAMLLRLDSFDVNESFLVTIGGKPLMRFNRDRLSLSFGPRGRSGITRLSKGSVGSYTPGVYAGPVGLLGSNPGITGEESFEASAASFAADEDKSAAEAIRWVELASTGMASIRLMVGDMAEPLARMRSCGEKHPARLAPDDGLPKPAKPPVPTGNPTRWLNPADYPAELIRLGAQGTTVFRLTIDTSGVPTGCRVLQETRPAGFGAAVCAAMIRNARFDPALDDKGHPVIGTWQNSARFQMPRQ